MKVIMKIIIIKIIFLMQTSHIRIYLLYLQYKITLNSYSNTQSYQE